MKLNFYRIFEIAVGSSIAIALAMLLGLQNSMSAGIITILSIQDTKEDTLRSALERVVAFLLAVATAFVAFSVIGYNVWAFGAFLVVFASASYLLKIQASLPISTVLVTHFWLAGHMRPAFIGNEALLVLIGTAIGVLLNLLPTHGANAMVSLIEQIEAQMRAYFHHVAMVMLGGAEPEAVREDVQVLNQLMRGARAESARLDKNTLIGDTQYYTQYVDMRQHQTIILRRMEDAIEQLDDMPMQAHALAGLMHKIGDTLHENNDASALLEELYALRQRFRDGPLPANRPEFETRATLYRILIDTEHFLLIKQSFAQTATPPPHGVRS